MTARASDWSAGEEMDVVNHLTVRFHYNGDFITAGRLVQYCNMPGFELNNSPRKDDKSLQVLFEVPL
ncbi:unnamed protein product [Urochloa humidicola]